MHFCLNTLDKTREYSHYTTTCWPGRAEEWGRTWAAVHHLSRQHIVAAGPEGPHAAPYATPQQEPGQAHRGHVGTREVQSPHAQRPADIPAPFATIGKSSQGPDTPSGLLHRLSCGCFGC